MSATEDTVTNWIADHPKLLGVLFTMMLLMTQAGSVAANGSATLGP